MPEGVEGRGLAKGNPGEQNALRTQSREQGALSALEPVREGATRDKRAQFSALVHHLTIERLRASYLALKRRAAAGVDGARCEKHVRNL
jgi:hypothetical protein